MDNVTKRKTKTWFALVAVVLMLAVPFAAVAGSAQTTDDGTDSDWVAGLIPATQTELPALGATAAEEVSALSAAVEEMMTQDAAALDDVKDGLLLQTDGLKLKVEAAVDTLYVSGESIDIHAVLTEAGVYDDIWRLLKQVGDFVSADVWQINERLQQWNTSDALKEGLVKYTVTVDSVSLGDLDSTYTGVSGLDVVIWGTPAEGADSFWFDYGQMDCSEVTTITGADGTERETGGNGTIFNDGELTPGIYTATVGKPLGNDISPVHDGMEISVAIFNHMASDIDYVVPTETATITFTDGVTPEVIDLMPLVTSYNALIDAAVTLIDGCAESATQAWAALDSVNEPEPVPETLEAIISVVGGTFCSAASSTGDIQSYQWYVNGNPEGEGVEFQLPEEYMEPGVYEIKLVVTGSDGTTSEDTVKVTIANEYGSGDLVAQIAIVEDDDGRKHYSAAMSLGDIQSYQWYFDGEDAGTGMEPVFPTGYEPGTYELKLVVTGSDGRTAEDTMQIEFGNEPPSGEGPEWVLYVVIALVVLAFIGLAVFILTKVI